MMKKLTAIALVIVLVFALSVAASAENSTITQANSSKVANAVITTSIDPTYTVTIPADVNVTFNTPSTNFGYITLTSAQINPGYAVKVELTASGTLKNNADDTKTIVYTIKDNKGDTFTSAQYTTAGQKTQLTINITPEAWNAAFAGSYSDTVTFTVSYEPSPSAPQPSSQA